MFTATARQSAAVMDRHTVDSTLRLVAYGSGCAAAFFSRARQSPALFADECPCRAMAPTN